MDFRKEIGEISEIIEEIKEALNVPLEEMKESPDYVLSLEDMEILLSRTQEIIDKLNRKANEICKKKGLTREEFSKIVEEPSHFHPEEWEAVQTMQKQVDDFHKSLMHASIHLKNEHLVKSRREEQKKQPLKGRKNWIPM